MDDVSFGKGWCSNLKKGFVKVSFRSLARIVQ